MIHAFNFTSQDDTRSGVIPFVPGAAPILSGRDIGNADFSRGGPFTVLAFHGTTHDFTKFCAAKHGNPEGAFGRVNYFTSDHFDARQNYAGEGPDLACRIESRAESMLYDIEEDLEAFGLPEDADDARIRDEAYAIARRALLGPSPQVKTLTLRFSKPFQVDGTLIVERGRRSLRRDTTPLLFPELWDIQSEAETEILDEHGLADLEGDARSEALEDLEDEVYCRTDEKRDGVVQRISEALTQVSWDLGIRVPHLPEEVSMELDGMTHQRLRDAFLNDENFMSIDSPEDGLMIGTDVFARLVEALGFDAIVLRNAAAAFPGMSIPDGAAHIHIFDSGVGNITEIYGPEEIEAPALAA